MREVHRKVDDLAALVPAIEDDDLYLQLTDAVADLGPLAKLTGLRRLILVAPAVTDLSPLSACTELEQLDLQLCPAPDLAPLRGLTRLRELSLGDDRRRRPGRRTGAEVAPAPVVVTSVEVMDSAQ